MDGHGGIDDFFHLPADGASILDGYRTPDIQIDIIAIGHWDVDHNTVLWGNNFKNLRI